MDVLRWLLDNALNFSAHLSVVAALGLGLAVYTRHWGVGLPLLVLFVLCAGWVLRSERLLVRAAPAPEGAAEVRVLTANLSRSNDDIEGLRAWAAGLEAEVVVLQEFPREGTAVAEVLEARYPHQVQDASGLLRVYSRVPFASARVHAVEDGPAGRDVIEVEVAWAPAPFRLVALHGTVTYRVDQYRLRREQFELAARLASPDAAGQAAVVAGDFNATVVSPSLAALLDDAGLRAVAEEGRVPPTYPTWLGPLGVRIDHVLVRGLRTVSVGLLEVPGSDHRAVLAVLVPEAAVRGD